MIQLTPQLYRDDDQYTGLRSDERGLTLFPNGSIPLFDDNLKIDDPALPRLPVYLPIMFIPSSGVCGVESGDRREPA